MRESIYVKKTLAKLVNDRIAVCADLLEFCSGWNFLSSLSPCQQNFKTPHTQSRELLTRGGGTGESNLPPPPLLHFKFCLSLSKTFRIGSIVKVNPLLKNILHKFLNPTLKKVPPLLLSARTRPPCAPSQSVVSSLMAIYSVVHFRANRSFLKNPAKQKCETL